MTVPILTLDTNVLQEYWKQRKKLDTIEILLDLAKSGIIDLAVTRRVREDIPRPPLSDRINELPLLRINETGSITREDYWSLDQDMLGDEAFEEYHTTACDLAKQRNKNPPDWRDWDHLHVHYLLHRDVFLTWDEGISCLSNELRAQFSISIMKPEDFTERIIGNGG